MEAIAGLLLAVAAAACLATLGASAADAVPLGEGEAPGQGSPVRNCSRSGYCSLGHVRPFQGDIHTPQGLRDALAARSYRQEIILTLSTGHRVESALQQYASFMALGIAHHIVLVPDQEACDNLMAVDPGAGCGYALDPAFFNASDPNPRYINPVAYIYQLRHRTAARIVRLDYNVLVIDSDITPVWDPYLFLKRPPFSDFQLMVHTEHSLTSLNCGAYYVQNAAPDGPVAHYLAEITDRILRITDNHTHAETVVGLHWVCMHWEQAVFNDALASMLTGTLAVSKTTLSCANDLGKASRQGLINQYSELIDASLVKHARNHQGFKVPPEWLDVVSTIHMTLSWIEVRMPHLGPNGTWLGDIPLLPARGPIATDFQAQLRADNPAPLWPDPEDGSQWQAAAAIPTEKFLLFPDWLVIGWARRGSQGYWEDRKEHAPQQVLAHLVYMPVDPDYLKPMVQRYVPNAWDWELHRKVKGDQIYVASTPKAPVPKLLALHPSVPLHLLQSERAYQTILKVLGQAAMLSGRAAVWPDMPCLVRWLAFNIQADPVRDGAGWRMTPKTNVTLPIVMITHYIVPHGPFEDLRCFYTRVAAGKCNTDGRGMTSAEWRHFKQTHPSPASLEPSGANTVLPLSAATAASLEGQPLVEQVVWAPAQQVLDALAAKQEQQVLYLAHPVALDFDGWPNPRPWHGRRSLGAMGSATAAASRGPQHEGPPGSANGGWPCDGCQWCEGLPRDLVLQALRGGAGSSVDGPWAGLADAWRGRDGAACDMAAAAGGEMVQGPHRTGMRSSRHLRAEGHGSGGDGKGAATSRREDLRTAIDEFVNTCEAFLEVDPQTRLLKPFPFVPANGSAARLNEAGELYLVGA